MAGIKPEFLAGFIQEISGEDEGGIFIRNISVSKSGKFILIWIINCADRVHRFYIKNHLVGKEPARMFCSTCEMGVAKAVWWNVSNG